MPNTEYTAKQLEQIRKSQQIIRHWHHRKNQATLAHFDAQLKTIQNTKFEDRYAGTVNAEVDECIRIIKSRNDRFLAQKLAYTLFSGDAYYFYRKPSWALEYLKQDLQNSEYPIEKLCRSLTQAFKNWCEHKYFHACHLSRDRELILKIQETLERRLQEIESETLDANTLKTLFNWNKLVEKRARSSRRGGRGRGGLVALSLPISHEELEEKKSREAFTQTGQLLHDLSELVGLYRSDKADSPIVALHDAILIIKQEVESVIDPESEVESIKKSKLIELVRKIEGTAQADKCEDAILGNAVQRVHFFGESQQKPADEVIEVRHGGGLFFLSQFLLGKNVGYQVDQEEGGTGMYLEPFTEGKQGSTNYGDRYYAERAALPNFDIPVALKAHGPRRAFNQSYRHGDEVILRHTSRSELRLDSIDVIPSSVQR